MLIWASLFPLAAAFLVLSRVSDLSADSGWAHLGNLALGLGLGLGISSLFLFCWLQVSGSFGLGYVATEATVSLGIAIGSALLLRRERGHGSPLPSGKPETGAKNWRQWLIPVCFAGVGVSSLLALGFWQLLLPHGEWDAWAIWNLRARFLFFTAELSPVVFAPFMSHTDYPLHLPLSVVRTWIYGNGNSQIFPALVACFYGLGTVALLVSAIARRRGSSAGLVAGMLLLTTPGFLTQIASQTADVPLAFTILATSILLDHFERSGRRATLLLAGLFTGLAAWTKNEGLMFGLVVSLVCLWFTLKKPRSFPSLAAFAVGLIPAGLMVLWFKLSLAPPNDLVSGQSLKTLPRLIDASRYAEIFGTFGRMIIQHYFWFPVLLAGLVICGAERKKLPRLVTATLSLMLAGYFLVYLSSPQPLTWHLNFSLDRILLQLWPSALFVLFSILKLPENADDALARKPDKL